MSNNDKNSKNSSKNNMIGGVGRVLGGSWLAPRAVGTALKYTKDGIGGVKYTLQTKNNHSYACPACCKKNLASVIKTIDGDDCFMGYECPACHLLIESEVDDKQALEEFIKDKGRILYITQGGRENHKQARESIDMSVGMCRLWVLMAVLVFLFTIFSLSSGGVLSVFIGFGLFMVAIITSISFAYEAYCLENGLMYLEGKPVFSDWLNKVTIFWWKYPIINEKDYDKED